MYQSENKPSAMTMQTEKNGLNERAIRQMDSSWKSKERLQELMDVRKWDDK